MRAKRSLFAEYPRMVRILARDIETLGKSTLPNGVVEIQRNKKILIGS
uniref:Uncharacterized protein n=1 Tax=Setaria digitata TaxID=48799 RepID=A0A915Q7X6_9BILA